jgi:hypothetical protein
MRSLVSLMSGLGVPPSVSPKLATRSSTGPRHMYLQAAARAGGAQG